MSAPVFISELAAGELVLADSAGWELIDLVEGVCCHGRPPGVPYWGVTAGREHRTIEREYSEGRARAIERMLAAARAQGAGGVIGVTLTAEPWTARDRTSTRSVHRYTASGTCVRGPGGRPGAPFASHLSARGTWGLMQAGYRPLGIVSGIAVRRADVMPGHNLEIGEIAPLTEAIAAARRAAMTQLEEQAAALGASGVVGVRPTARARPGYPGMFASFSVLGTAVARDGERMLPPARLGVALDDDPASPASLVRAR